MYWAACRIEQVVERAAAQHLHSVGEVVVAADHQHHGLVVQPSQPGDQFDPVHFRHADVGDQQVRLVVPQQVQRLLAVPRLQNRLHGNAGAPDHGDQALADEFFIFGNQDCIHGLPSVGSWNGKDTVTAVPPPG